MANIDSQLVLSSLRFEIWGMKIWSFRSSGLSSGGLLLRELFLVCFFVKFTEVKLGFVDEVGVCSLFLEFEEAVVRDWEKLLVSETWNSSVRVMFLGLGLAQGVKCLKKFRFDLDFLGFWGFGVLGSIYDFLKGQWTWSILFDNWLWIFHEKLTLL